MFSNKKLPKIKCHTKYDHWKVTMCTLWHDNILLRRECSHGFSKTRCISFIFLQHIHTHIQNSNKMQVIYMLNKNINITSSVCERISNINVECATTPARFTCSQNAPALPSNIYMPISQLIPLSRCALSSYKLAIWAQLTTIAGVPSFIAALRQPACMVSFLVDLVRALWKPTKCNGRIQNIFVLRSLSSDNTKTTHYVITID